MRAATYALPSAVIAAILLGLMPITPVLPAVAGVKPTELTKGPSDVFSFLEEETVSSAIRREHPISQAPSNVYVITAEDIRHSGASDLPTILRRIPGIEVIQTSGAEFNVSARGDNQLLANKMLVLVDGRSVYIDVQGFVFWKGIPVTLPEIKQIEVIKGPIAALYGFNAFDGLVNIITKSPEEMEGTTLQVGAGEFGTLMNSAVHAGKQGKLGYRLSVGEEQNQRWRNRDGLAFRSYKFNGQTDYALSGLSKVSASGGLVYMNRHDGPLTGAGNTNLDSGVKLPYISMAYERQNFFVRSYWNGFFAKSDALAHPLLTGFIRTTDPLGSSRLEFNGNTYNIEAQHSIEVGGSNRLTYGTNYRHNTFSCNCLSAFGREDRLGFYVQDEWSATPSVNVVAGLRHDLHSEINPTFSPRLAILYTPVPGQTLRAQGSVAYRPPTLFETGEDLRLVPLADLLGSKDLRPERMVSYEVGYQGWFYRHRLRVRADLFFNHISDLIGPSGGTTVRRVNGGVADIYGGEAGVEILPAPWLTGFANFAYQEIGQTLTGSLRRGAPRFKINAGLRGEWDNGWSSEAVLHHVGAATYPIAESFGIFGVSPGTRVGSYNLLNLRIAYRFWQRQAEAAFTAFNALNDRHKEHPVGDVIGSRVMGWLTLKF